MRWIIFDDLNLGTLIGDYDLLCSSRGYSFEEKSFSADDAAYDLLMDSGA